ncbi:OmpA family protein [Pseudomonas helleri]|uniref:OmpA family protein n=1 Tax=Pseudomonas helleri TaxID=1608996 RepID=UPI00333F8C14
MFTQRLSLYATLLLALGLTGCAAGVASSSQRSEHHYMFSKPQQPPVSVRSASTVAPVEAQPSSAKRGPADVAHIVYFDFDSFSVRKADRSVIEGHARWLQANPQQSLVLQGNTDVRGGAEYNLALGQKRADAVRKNLELLGVQPSRVEAVSYGKERLADQGTSEAAHQRNRRVEFEYR